MTTVPATCPYCGTDVSHVHPERKRAPPDIRRENPAHLSLPGGRPAYHVLSHRRLAPCGHYFRTDALRAWDEGVITIEELGDRVQNPGAPYE